VKKAFRYVGYRFRQRQVGPETVLFLAPAEEVRIWGGVPQKTSKFMRGFQRAQVKRRLQEISKFFARDENISPTAVVVAFRPAQVVVREVKMESSSEHDVSPLGTPVVLEVPYDDLSEHPVEELAQMVYEIFGAVSGEEDGEDDAGNEEDVSDEESPAEPEDEEESELAVHESHLQDFLAFLKAPHALQQAREENESKLRQDLENWLKPATIVDGQHRVHGAAFLEKKICFPVVGLLETDWSEQVFQFVVINQSAEPIHSEFLSSIISSSLSPAEIGALKSRLEEAGVDLDETRIMDKVHSHPHSPFKGMIDYKVEGGSGRLKYTGMLALARRFRKVKTHKRETKFRLLFKAVFEQNCAGTTPQEKRQNWLDDDWFRFFSVFWNRVYFKMCEEPGYAELWEPGKNLLKIVTLQEFQNVFLEWLHERGEMIGGEDDFKTKVDLFLKIIRPKFFEKEWQLKSLQSATGRKFLRAAIENARKDPKYKYNDELFLGTS
jgi:hypothetical protein